jgi:hypothetical protein
MLEPLSPAAITFVRRASASALVGKDPSRTRYPRLVPPASASFGVGTSSTRGSSPAAFNFAAAASAPALSDRAVAGASGSGEVDGIATSTVQVEPAPVWPRVIVVSVTPACRVEVWRVSARLAGPSGSPPPASWD